MTVPAGKDIGLAGEIGRKAIHLFALVLPLGLLVVPLEIARPIIIAAFLISVSIDLIRFRGGRAAELVNRVFGRVLRPHEHLRFSGATYILAAAALCPILFSRPVAVAALVFIILGDTAAVFVGRYFGRISIGHKTLEGSIGFFVAAFLGTLWITTIPLHIRLYTALFAAFVEALPLPIDDNLSVPLAAGALMSLLLY